MMDKIDLRLLNELQKDCRLSMNELGDKVALSPSACHRRIKQLEALGVINGYVARVDGKKIGYEIEFFVEVSLKSQQRDTLAAFEQAVKTVPEILECHLMTGQADYIMRVAASDTADYERFYRDQIAQLPGVSRIQSSLVLRTIRQPAGYALKS